MPRAPRPALHFTGRFSETGDDKAAALELEIERTARSAGVRILGPNGLGVYHPAGQIALRPDLPQAPGNVAFLSQSGNNAIEVAIRALPAASNSARWPTTATEDLTPASSCATSPRPRNGRHRRVRRGCARWEGLLQGLRCRRAEAGHHPQGRRTRLAPDPRPSHTAALAGSVELLPALRQAGAIEARSQEQLIDLMLGASLLALGPATEVGRRVAVVGGGGRSVQSADACEENGLDVVPPTRRGPRAGAGEGRRSSLTGSVIPSISRSSPARGFPRTACSGSCSKVGAMTWASPTLGRTGSSASRCSRTLAVRVQSPRRDHHCQSAFSRRSPRSDGERCRLATRARRRGPSRLHRRRDRRLSHRGACRLGARPAHGRRLT